VDFVIPRVAKCFVSTQGGLDGRYLISKLKPTTFKVISLTTISTPHRGSPFADYFIDNIIGRESGSIQFLDYRLINVIVIFHI